MNPGPTPNFVKILNKSLLFVVGAALCGGAQAADRYTDIHCGQLLDVEERQVLRDHHILVRNDLIERVGREVDTPEGASIIDLSQAVCAPGLIDSHVHLFIDATDVNLDLAALLQSSAYNALLGLSNARTLLSIGVTTIRVPGDDDQYYAGVELRNAIERGWFAGPRMQVAPHYLSPLGGHGDSNALAADSGVSQRTNIADGIEGLRLAVRREIKYGADWIKVMGTGGVMSQHDDPEVAAYSQEEFIALANEAHRHRKKITAHVHGDSGARMAVLAGFDSLEHGTMLEEETIDLMARRGTYLVPTRYVLDWILEMGQKGGITANNLAKARLVNQTHAKAIRMAYERGVKMAVGSDPIYPMEQATREFAAMARIIPDPWFVLRAGTISAAEMLDLDHQIGSLSPGKQADIVAMPRSPLDEMRNIEDVSFVMKGGIVVRNRGLLTLTRSPR